MKKDLDRLIVIFILSLGFFLFISNQIRADFINENKPAIQNQTSAEKTVYLKNNFQIGIDNATSGDTFLFGDWNDTDKFILNNNTIIQLIEELNLIQYREEKNIISQTEYYIKYIKFNNQFEAISEYQFKEGIENSISYGVKK